MKRRLRQREFGFTNWGGKRKGAGRKPKGAKAMASHAKRERLKARYPVFVTMRLRAGLRNLRANDTHTLLEAAFVAASRESFRIVEHSIQSNHLHLLVESQDERALARGMIGLSVRIVRGLNKLWKRSGSVFEDRYHARILTTPSAVRNALVYVLNNARKHGAWIAKSPDVYSSGLAFDGWRLALNPAISRSRLLPSPRTWLLSVGWKRSGLLDVLEAPKEESRLFKPRHRRR
jgi:REP-associated tyrosine transposase